MKLSNKSSDRLYITKQLRVSSVCNTQYHSGMYIIQIIGTFASQNYIWRLIPFPDHSNISCIKHTLCLVVVEFETHAVVDLVILESDVILVYGVPLLDADLVGSCARLSRHQLLQVADGVIVVALHAHLLPQSIVQHHLDHLRDANNPNSQFQT
uniref:Uncharacterized protein n=1 Tax=Glycine max TaxID=3847 RepID=C6SXJ1_SOYBN|nr:unknown [Glycine max]